MAAVVSFVPVAQALLWAADVVLLLLFGVDFLRTPSVEAFQVERTLPTRVGLGRDFPRTLVLTQPRAAGRHIRVFERFPAAFEVRARSVGGELVAPPPADPSGGPDGATADDKGRVSLVRSYRSDLRGVFELGALRVRVRSPWGLSWRQGRLEGPQAVAVEPALVNLKQTLLLAASDRWQDLGLRRLRRHGGQTEFESLREYVTGDDVRRVDWKAFARRGKPMVRQYQLERGQELILLLDCGRRMRAATAHGKRRGWTKLDWGLDAAFELAAVAVAKGDRVGLAAFDRRLVRWIAPKRGARQLTRIQSAHFDLQPSENDSDLGRALRELAVRHRRRATVVVVSDVADPLSVERQRLALALASRRHRVVFSALDDPGLRMATAAAGAGRSDPALRAAAFELQADRARSLRVLRASGARVLDALPAEAAAPLLAAWLDERRR